jgi:hypothetical protein
LAPTFGFGVPVMTYLAIAAAVASLANTDVASTAAFLVAAIAAASLVDITTADSLAAASTQPSS